MADSDGIHALLLKIAEMYSEVDDRILQELHWDVVMTVMRDVQRIRLQVFEKRLAEARAKASSPPKEALN
jgi:hypothetical protein